MDKEKIKENIERLKIKSEIFLDNDIKAFIKDVAGNYYFCDILIVGEDRLMVKDFTGKRRDEKSNLLWIDIVSLEEYRK